MHRLNDELNKRSHLRKLGQRLAQYEALLEHVRASLTAPVDQQVKAAVMHNGCLTLFAESPAWASRLRYMAPQLQRNLAARAIPVTRVEVRISPAALAVRQASGRHAEPMSEHSSESLRLTAETLADEGLKQALLRLSRHVSRD
ncbi:MAG: DciA family protein [Candidatus Thiodiazotropha sp.]